jgi:selenocysteine lyase/cysteine desulfurase
MTGTQNHECLAGTLAAIDYIAGLGQRLSCEHTERREALTTAYATIRAYEMLLTDHLLDGLAEHKRIRVVGITEPGRRADRFPTVSIVHDDWSPRYLAQRLADESIFVWHGNYYALPLTERLGLEPESMVRVGLVHYNTLEEVERLLRALR